MPDPGVRVALLARAGDVREQLRRALTEYGAEVVAEGDPAELDPGTVAGRQPGVVVVSLEPSIEDALAEFDDLLAMPGVQVIYDDAEVTGQLDGWDLARWARHLAAKLAGHGTVLPPAPADAEPVADAIGSAPDIQPGAPPTPAQEMDHHRLEDYAAESVDLSDWVPSTPSLTDVPIEADAAAPAAGEAGDDPAAELDLELDLDLAGLEQAMAAPAADAAAGGTDGTADDAGFGAEAGLDDLTDDTGIEPGPVSGAAVESDTGPEPDLGDFVDLSVAGKFSPDAADVATDPAPMPADEPLLVDFEMAGGPINFSSFTDEDDTLSLGVDDDVAALAAQLDAYEGGVRGEAVEPDFARAAADEAPLSFDEPLSLDSPLSLDDSPAPAVPAPAPAATAFAGDFDRLELAPMEGDTGSPAPARPAPPPDEPVTIGFGTLSLVDEDAPSTPPPAAKPEAALAPAIPSTLSLVGDEGSTGVATFGASPAAAPDAGRAGPGSGAAARAAPARAVAARRGALFVVAGLGGPDGVRQLLAALPPELPVPVLLYQHLDTGKHDRLVGQLSKASRLPLDLAVAGQAAAAGRVAVLPPGIGVEPRGDGFDFVAGATLPSIVAALPAGESAVLVLSGGDPGVVAAVQAMQAAGGRVFAQEPASCFDAGAPEALIASGASTAPVPGLARLISECWS